MSGNQKRSRLFLKFEGLYRRVFMRFLADKKRSFLLCEFPKSGGSWLTKMLSDAAGLDFPQNRFPLNRVSAFQGHYLSHYGQKNIIILWRDPRDIMVSWYFHSVVGNSHSNQQFVQSVRQACQIGDPDDVVTNLPAFIRFSFSGKMSPGFSWNDFHDYWADDKSATHTSYEALRRDPVSEVSRILMSLGKEVPQGTVCDIVEKYSFRKMSGRKAGQEDKGSFARKGVVGDWVNYFSDEALSVFNDLVGDRLVRLGYDHER